MSARFGSLRYALLEHANNKKPDMRQRLFLALIAALTLPAAQAATLGVLVVGPGNFSSAQDLSPDQFVIDPQLEIGSTALAFFRAPEFSGLDASSTLEWTINPSNEPTFEFLQDQLSNGVDQALRSCISSGGSTTTCSSLRESQIFADVLLPGAVDLTGFELTSVTLTVSNIEFVPFNGSLTRMFWDTEYRFEGRPVPLPGALVFFLGALGSFSLTRGRRVAGR